MWLVKFVWRSNLTGVAYFSSSGYLETLYILYNGQRIWKHDYAFDTPRTTDHNTLVLIAAGADMHTSLSDIKQKYMIHDQPERYTKQIVMERARGNFSYITPNCDDRSLVKMVEDGDIKYNGYSSMLIRRVEPESFFCNIVFAYQPDLGNDREQLSTKAGNDNDSCEDLSEQDVAYTRALEGRVPPSASDNSETLRRYYTPEALASYHERQRAQQPPTETAVKKTDTTPVSLPRNLPLPIGLPTGLPMVFAAVPAISSVGILPQALQARMVPGKDKIGGLLGIPVGAGSVDALRGMPRDEYASKPRVESIGAHPLGSKPVVETFPGTNRPQVSTETFPRASTVGATVLMAKKSGDSDNHEQRQRMQNPQKSASPIWRQLKHHNDITKTNGETGSKREYYQWDIQHNDIEVYDSRGNHKGSMDPITGEIYKRPSKTHNSIDV